MSTQLFDRESRQLFKDTQNVFRALSHDLRAEIFNLIHKSGEITVTDIHTRLRIEQSVASQMLSILRHAGFVKTRREGQNIYYSINRVVLDRVKEYASLILYNVKLGIDSQNWGKQNN